MKLVGVENNLVNKNDNWWLITSDKPINKNAYYFEVELRSMPSRSTGYIGYLFKNMATGGFDYVYEGSRIEDIRKIYSPSFIILVFPEDNKFYIMYNTRTKQEIVKVSQSITLNMVLNSIIGLGIELNSNKSVNFDIYINGVLKDQIIKENFDDFDFNNLYIATFNQWNHNYQYAQYYFEKDLKYQNIASKYNKKFILFESGGGVSKYEQK